MSRKAARFTEADIVRAIKAIKRTGESLAVEIAPDGTIRIVPVVPAISMSTIEETIKDRPGRNLLADYEPRARKLPAYRKIVL